MACVRAVGWPGTTLRANFSEKAEPPKEPPVPHASGCRHGLRNWRAWLPGEEVFTVLLVPSYLPELWAATSVGVLGSKLGSRAGAVAPEQKAGPVPHSLLLLCGGPCTETLGGSRHPRAVQLSLFGVCYFSPLCYDSGGKDWSFQRITHIM